MKPLKLSLSLVIEGSAGLLLVRRPEGDESLRWGDVAELLPAARRGSLCARVLLRERGIAPG